MPRTLEHFIAAANSPQTWFRSGDDLLLTARAIWDAEFQKSMNPDAKIEIPARLFNGFFLLAGFGLESLFKGLRVSQMLDAGTASVTNQKGELNRSLKTHNLVKLAADTGIAPTLVHNQQMLLERLTLLISWAARYPVKLSYTNELNPRMLISSDITDIETIAKGIKSKEMDYWRVVSIRAKSDGSTLTTKQAR
jgi:hypothetical protein